VCVCACVCVCVSVCLSGYTFPHFSTDLLQIWREPSTGHDSWRGLFLFSAHNARACACVLNARACVHLLIFERIISNVAGYILLLTLSVKDYVLFMFTHRAHACERACARACVIKNSLIYGPTLLKFAVDILQITSSSMGYVLTYIAWAMFTHRAHACERARACARVVKTFTYLRTDSLQICCAHTTDDHKLHGLHNYHVHAPGAHARARVCERARD
jgi:hypothetical protein